MAMPYARHCRSSVPVMLAAAFCLFVFAGLIAYRAGGFAGRLTAGLALSAAFILYIFVQTRFAYGLDMFHVFPAPLMIFFIIIL